MPPFELHFTDAWLTFLFGLGGVGYIFLIRIILNHRESIDDKLTKLRLDIERIKIILRLNVDDRVIKPERFHPPERPAS